MGSMDILRAKLRKGALKTAYLEGISINQIAIYCSKHLECSISPSQIRNILIKEGVTLRSHEEALLLWSERKRLGV